MLREGARSYLASAIRCNSRGPAKRLAIQPKQIRMRLRSGDGRPLRAAEINGAATPVLAGDTIRLPDASAGKYHIVGRFDP